MAAREELACVRPRANVVDEKTYGAATDALTMIRGIDHEAPEEVISELSRIRSQALVVQHRKPTG